MEIPEELFAMNLTVTALRIYAAMRLKGERQGDVFVWNGSLTELVKPWDIAKGTLSGGAGNLAVNGLLRQQVGAAVTGRKGRPAQVWIAPAQIGNKSSFPNQFSESGTDELGNKSSFPNQFSESETVGGGLAAYNTTTATTTATAPDLERKFEPIALAVLERLGEKHGPVYAKRWGLLRVVGGLVDLDHRMRLYEERTPGVAPVINPLGWLNDRLVHQRDFDIPADCDWASRWLPAAEMARAKGWAVSAATAACPCGCGEHVPPGAACAAEAARRTAEWARAKRGQR